MNRLFSSLVALVFVASLGSGISDAKQCRDKNGKFMKCPTTASSMGSMKMSPKQCRDKNGKFMKCSK